MNIFIVYVYLNQTNHKLSSCYLWRFHCGLILNDTLWLSSSDPKKWSDLSLFKLSFIKSQLYTNKITGHNQRLIIERNRGKCNSDCWILKTNRKTKPKHGRGTMYDGGKMHLTCILWEPYAAKLTFIFRWINCGGLRKVESGWLGRGGGSEGRDQISLWLLP